MRRLFRCAAMFAALALMEPAIATAQDAARIIPLRPEGVLNAKPKGGVELCSIPRSP